MATSEKKKVRLEALERRLSAALPVSQAQRQVTSKNISVSTVSPSVFGTSQPPRSQAENQPSPYTYAPPGPEHLRRVPLSSRVELEVPEISERQKTYAQLCPSVVNGPLYSLLKLSGGNDPNEAINGFLKNLLKGNSKLQGDVEGVLEARLQENQYLLLDNPSQNQVSVSEKARERAYRNRGKRSREHMSLRRQRKCGSYDLPQEFQQYKLYQPLQEMWATYAKDLLSECSETMVQSRLLTADLHGAVLSVVESKSSSYVGARGVMVRETENTFGLVTPNNKFRVIPKVGTIFRLELDNMRVTLFGNNLYLRSSAADPKRGRKKLRPTIEV